MQASATVEPFRQAAFDVTRPKRLKRVVELGAALGIAGVEHANAFDQIEDAIWAGGVLPIDRASQRRAWSVALDRALYAFRNADDLVEQAAMRAYHAAPALLERLPATATVEDLAAAMLEAEPFANPSAVGKLASGVVRALANGSAQQRAPHAVEIFDTVTSATGDREDILRDRARELLSARKAPRATFDLATEPGLLGDIARWSQTFAFRPVQEFAQPAALATLAALFGRRWATPTGLGLNLYIVAIGETGIGKDALIGAPRSLLTAAGFRHLLGPGDFSSDAAIEKSLRTRPAQLMPLDEFGKLAQAMMGRNAPAFAKLAAKALLEIYPRSQPGSEWTGKARASDDYDAAAEPIHSPTLSLLGVSTPEGFFEGMSQATLEDGFLNRLTVVRAGQRGGRQHSPARLVPPDSLLDAIRSAYEASANGGNLSEAASRDARSTPHIRCARWADDGGISALHIVEAWEDGVTEAGRHGVAGRTAEQVQKVATLRALARDANDPRVTADDINWAFEFVIASIDTIESGAREMMAGSEFETLVQAIERAIAKAGPDGIARSHLVRAKGVSKADDRMVDAAIKRLEISERIWRLAAGSRFRIRHADERAL